MESAVLPDFKPLSSQAWASPQISPDDVFEAARRGVSRIICNRPDGEEPGQPSAADLAAVAESANIEFIHAPVAGMPSPDVVQSVAEALRDDQAVLLYCRSGMRSAAAWALAMRSLGRGEPEDLRAAAASAGYDLSRLPL